MNFGGCNKAANQLLGITKLKAKRYKNYFKLYSHFASFGTRIYKFIDRFSTIYWTMLVQQ